MKVYSALSPSIHGIISEDDLFYEGLRKPEALYALRDGVSTESDPVVLERYWNDIYNLFLRKLTHFAGTGPTSHEDALKLQALLQELIKVKSLIENAAKTDIMGK